MMSDFDRKILDGHTPYIWQPESLETQAKRSQRRLAKKGYLDMKIFDWRRHYKKPTSKEEQCQTAN